MAREPQGPVIYSVKVNGTTNLDFPASIELEQRWGHHDIMTVKVQATSNHPYRKLLRAWKDGAPIEILWGRLPDQLNHWYGYVNHKEHMSEDEFSAGQSIQQNYYLIGTSKVMNSHRNRAWTNITPSVIAYKIAKEHGFRCVSTKTLEKFDYELQAFESDFQFLNRIADKIGFRFWVSGGTLYFIDPSVVIQGKNSRFVPNYLVDRYPGYRDTAMNFHSRQGDNLPGSAIVARQLWGMDGRGKIFRVLADGANDKLPAMMHPEWHVRSIAEGKARINASQSLSQFWLYASVDVGGFSLLYPGKVLTLSGHGMADQNQGAWMVTAVKHVLKSKTQMIEPTVDSYYTHVELMKNVKNERPNIKGVQPVKPEMVTCILAGGKWQSTNLNSIQEGVVLQ